VNAGASAARLQLSFSLPGCTDETRAMALSMCPIRAASTWTLNRSHNCWLDRPRQAAAFTLGGNAAILQKRNLASPLVPSQVRPSALHALLIHCQSENAIVRVCRSQSLRIPDALRWLAEMASANPDTSIPVP